MTHSHQKPSSKCENFLEYFYTTDFQSREIQISVASHAQQFLVGSICMVHHIITFILRP